MSEEPYTIHDVEKRETEVVYWVAAGGGKREFGIVFDEPVHNIARQGIVESLLFSSHLGGELIEEALK